MLSETDGLRTRPVSDQKNSVLVLQAVVLVLHTWSYSCLAGLVLCCETRSCYARRHNDLEGQQLFSTIYSSVLGTSLLWTSTVAFTYFKVKVKCFCLLLVVLLMWSWYPSLSISLHVSWYGGAGHEKRRG